MPPVGTTLPAMKVEISFSTTPLAAPVWVDVSSYVRSGWVRRGRQNELSGYDAGTAVIVLDNRDRRFDPAYTSSPYYPNVLPLKRVRVSATWNSVTYPLFTGYIEGWPQSWPGNRDGIVEVKAVDGFKILNLLTVLGHYAKIDGTEENDTGQIQVSAPMHGLQTGEIVTIYGVEGATETNGTWTVTYVSDDHFSLDGSVWANDYVSGGTVATFIPALASARADAILTAVGWPAADRLIDSSISSVQAIAYDNVPALQALQTLELSENGRLYMDKQGRLRFENRHSPYLTSSAATFAGTEYRTPEVSYDDSQIWNDVHVTRDGGVEQVVQDSASQAAYFKRSLLRSGLIITHDNEANDNAQFLISLYKDPQLRIPSVQLLGARNPSVNWPKILSRELGERITMTVQPPAGGSLISQISFVDGIDIEWRTDPINVEATLQLTMVGIGYNIYPNGKGFFILGDTTYGVVGATGLGVLTY